MTGWDRPLQYFFLDIRKPCTPCEASGSVLIGNEPDAEVSCEECGGEGEVIIFDNLDAEPYASSSRGGMVLSEVGNELNKYLTEIPSDVMLKLAGDQNRNAGNEVTKYDPVGRLRDPNQRPAERLV